MRFCDRAGRNGPIHHPPPVLVYGNRITLSDRTVGLLFIAPFVTAALFFMVYPIVEAVRMAFYSYNPLRPELTTFVGFDNFVFIFNDPLFWNSFRQATIWTFLSIVFQTAFGVAIAMLLHRTLPGMAVFRGLLLFPYIVPTVVIALSGAGSSTRRSAW